MVERERVELSQHKRGFYRALGSPIPSRSIVILVPNLGVGPRISIVLKLSALPICVVGHYLRAEERGNDPQAH